MIYIVKVSTNYHSTKALKALSTSIQKITHGNIKDIKNSCRERTHTKIFKDYFCQKIGINKTNNVNISSLPNIMAKDNIALPAEVTDAYV